MDAGSLNLRLAWVWILAGLVAGAAQGLFFHREEWLGGYASWRRRMVRLGHVSFFGTAIVNLLAVFTIRSSGSSPPRAAWLLLALGTLAMPGVCYGSALHEPTRRLFPLPVVCLIVGVALVVREVWR